MKFKPMPIYQSSAIAAMTFSSLVAMTSVHAVASSITLSPGANIQAAVAAAPAGTTFVLKAGVYRLQSIVPKNNDHFTGAGSVELNGSQVLSFQIDPAGSGYWVASATSDNIMRGLCDSDHPLCGYDQDLFIDSSPQAPAGSISNLAAGSWYFDRTNGKVYIPTNPAGHVLELGTATYAFSGSASNVVIDHITVDKYAAPAQLAAIGGSGLGRGWEVNSVESCFNHGAGVYLGPGSQLLSSYVHHNGQIGIKFIGANGKAIGNEVSWNNYAGFSTIWEAGGSKFWATTNLLVQANYVHDNNGKGLWTDTDNVGTIYEQNTVQNNSGVGIQHEVSYAATIRNNIIQGNAPAPTTWLGNAQVRVMSSSDVNIYGNTVETAATGGNAIAVYNSTRGSGTLGLWVAANNYVHNNSITYLAAGGQSGFQNDGDATLATGNRFDYNTYTSADGGTGHWFWYHWLTFPQMQTAGQELHGHNKQ